MEAELLAKEESEEYHCFRDSYILTMSQKGDANRTMTDDGELDDLCDITQLENGEFESFAEMEQLDMTRIEKESSRPIVFIQTFKSEINGIASLDRTLEEIKPRYIVMYHSNVTAIRQIEVFEARQQRTELTRVRVFQAFELLIDTKRTMVVPEYQDGKSEDAITMLQKAQEVSSRQAGGQAADDQVPVTPRIIVDMREFRSDLPCLIHRRGIESRPAHTITNKPFHLQRNFVVSGDAGSSNADIMQKLQLLTMHFPKLKLVWSPSPYATAQLFEELKQGKLEPDPDVAALVGSDEAGGPSEMENIAGVRTRTFTTFSSSCRGLTPRTSEKLCESVKI
ncbi:hypothetical protein quinque_002090 [Culex quinquefasciatus]